MDDLRRLVKLVEKYGLSNFPLINLNDDKTLEANLFVLLKEDEVANDKEAASKLSVSNNGKVSYRMLKSRFKRKLLNHLHFVKFPENKTLHTNRIKVQCAKALYEAEILKTFNELRLAEKILDDALALAEQNEIHDYIVKILELQLWLCQMLAEGKKYELVSQRLRHFYELENLEKEATKLFLDILVIAKINFGSRLNLLNNYDETIGMLKRLWEQSRSSKIYYYFSFLSLQYYELKGDYQSIASFTERAELDFDKSLVHKNWFNFKFNGYMRVYALLQTGEYENGLKLAEKYIEHFDQGSINWYAFMENYISLAFYKQDYALAEELLHNVFSIKQFKILPTPQVEAWELYRRHWLLITNYIYRSEKPDLQAITDVVVLPKDKTGFNVAIIVIETLERLANPDLFEFDFDSERLKRYIVKYLRGDKAKRARIFLRLLILTIKENFDSKSILLKSKNMVSTLKRTPPPGDAFSEVEIVPYEHLWEITLRITAIREKSLHLN